ncbi:hypothetical protein C8R43DRAFT_960691 [Mycena crocata]|nr:hypothetical protein C8R43DRAFT_960691 [Mycena crocata]
MPCFLGRIQPLFQPVPAALHTRQSLLSGYGKDLKTLDAGDANFNLARPLVVGDVMGTKRETSLNSGPSEVLSPSSTHPPSTSHRGRRTLGGKRNTCTLCGRPLHPVAVDSNVKAALETVREENRHSENVPMRLMSEQPPANPIEVYSHTFVAVVPLSAGYTGGEADFQLLDRYVAAGRRVQDPNGLLDGADVACGVPVHTARGMYAYLVLDGETPTGTDEWMGDETISVHSYCVHTAFAICTTIAATARLVSAPIRTGSPAKRKPNEREQRRHRIEAVGTKAGAATTETVVVLVVMTNAGHKRWRREHRRGGGHERERSAGRRALMIATEIERVHTL